MIDAGKSEREKESLRARIAYSRGKLKQAAAHAGETAASIHNRTLEILADTSTTATHHLRAILDEAQSRMATLQDEMTILDAVLTELESLAR